MKVMRRKRKFNIYIIIVLTIIAIISAIFLLPKKANISVISEETQASYTIAKGEYVLQSNDSITIIPEDSNKNIYVEIYKIKIDFEYQDVTNNKYQIEYGTNGILKTEDIAQNNLSISIELKEGENNITVNIKKENNYICKWENTIFYIKPYQKQYLDELEENGYASHFGYPWNADSNSQVELLKKMGINCIRDDIRWNLIEKENGKYDYSKYDKWIEEVYKNDIDIIGILGYPDQLIGSDKKFSSQEEVDKFLNFAEDVINRYNGKIMHYEFWNEPNTILLTDEDMKWYSEVVKGLKNIINRINPDIKLTIGALRTDGVNTDYFNTSDNIINGFYNNNLDTCSDNISLHIYQYKGNNINNYYKTVLKKHNQIFNDFGGFENVLITEQGASTYKEGVDEERQSSVLVTQSIMDDKLGIRSEFKYSYRDLQSVNSSDEEAIYNFGSVKDDYTPKKSYYAMKNYYENTNGAEYIGTVNSVNGLEIYVYNKDGKPKIITWSANSDKTIEIDYTGFTAKDLYGNDIENTNGKLDITTSPVYLDNISTKYFYEAISNTALENYSEFEEKFATEIASVDGLQENIDTLKQYLKSISNIENESEEIAKQKMKEHFDLGNQILTSYTEKELDVEYVKLSSMLDMLNEIGDSFEDLVTVTAKTRNPDLENTKTLIDNAEQAINNNNDLDIVYPEKILEFSKDLYEDSEYINNLEEENDIKTGLIVSYDLHAKYLADWANVFTNLYIDKYIEENPITVSYSATSLTNQDVTVTLNIPQDVKITNNEGSNIYTFTENGTFTFEYERRGKTDSKLVSVNYIDKTSPEITNVENGEAYTQSVSPNVSDEHLDKVQLTFKGQVIEDYEIGDELTEEGEYKLTATDTVGNTSTVKFYIMKEDSTFKISNSYILNINPETTTKSFMENFTIIEGYKIKNEDTELGEEDKISTGDILEDEDGTKFILVVKGDLNRDGRLSIVDLSIGRKYLLGIIDIDEVQKLSSDMNTDEETSLTDLSIMRKTILGIIK